MNNFLFAETVSVNNLFHNGFPFNAVSKEVAKPLVQFFCKPSNKLPLIVTKIEDDQLQKKYL